MECIGVLDLTKTRSASLLETELYRSHVLVFPWRGFFVCVICLTFHETLHRGVESHLNRTLCQEFYRIPPWPVLHSLIGTYNRGQKGLKRFETLCDFGPVEN